eukprot:scaffold3307_cov116-Skeletonema_dohrnii-CCMP3373.AAC.10
MPQSTCVPMHDGECRVHEAVMSSTKRENSCHANYSSSGSLLITSAALCLATGGPREDGIARRAPPANIKNKR